MFPIKFQEAEMVKAVIFDLDGTMWDSSEAVTEAYNRGLARMGIALRLTVADVRAAMGKTMTEIAHMYFDAVDPGRAEYIMTECIAEEMEYLKTTSGKVYPGLEDALIKLKEDGYFLACVSNCQSGYIEAFYSATGLGKYFSDLECWGGTGMLKAENIKLVCERNGLCPAIYVGDTMGDYESSKKAGTAFIHAAYGYGSVPEGTPEINSPAELFDAVKNIQ